MYEPKYGSPFVVEGVGLVVRGGLRSPVTRIFPQPWGGLWPPSLTHPWGCMDHISLWIRYMSTTTYCLPYIRTLSSNFQIMAPTHHPAIPTGAVKADFWKTIYPLFQYIRLLGTKTLNSQLNPNLLCSAVELQRGSAQLEKLQSHHLDSSIYHGWTSNGQIWLFGNWILFSESLGILFN